MKRFLLARSLLAALLIAVPCAAYGRPQVLYSPSGRYAFPVAGDVGDMAWTHYHWNGGNAVDILPAPDLVAGSKAFEAFEHAPIVAVVEGTVKPADNEIGGTALVLFGDDGREYYYAHLSSTTISGPTRVRAGQQIGVIGRSGRWARYIEIHLHLAITSRWHRGLAWPNNVNVAEWLYHTFDLHWIDQTPKPYPPAFPAGSPLAEPYRVVDRFPQMQASNPDTASIRMAPDTAVLPQVPVYSTLLGEVRVMRATVFGLRLQITNRHTRQTVVYSGLSSATRETGSIVRPGEIVGWTAGPIDYMYFDKGVLADPTAMLAAGVASPGRSGGDRRAVLPAVSPPQRPNDRTVAEAPAAAPPAPPGDAELLN